MPDEVVPVIRLEVRARDFDFVARHLDQMIPALFEPGDIHSLRSSEVQLGGDQNELVVRVWFLKSL